MDGYGNIENISWVSLGSSIMNFFSDDLSGRFDIEGMSPKMLHSIGGLCIGVDIKKLDFALIVDGEFEIIARSTYYTAVPYRRKDGFYSI